MATLLRKKKGFFVFLAQEGEKKKKKDCRTGGARKEAALLVRQPAATKLFLCVLILDISLQSVSSFMRLWEKKEKKTAAWAKEITAKTQKREKSHSDQFYSNQESYVAGRRTVEAEQALIVSHLRMLMYLCV